VLGNKHAGKPKVKSIGHIECAPLDLPMVKPPYL
jgi:hypothetical protein